MKQLSYLIMHLSGQILQLHPGVFQRVLLNMIRWSVSQELVQCDDVAWDLARNILSMIDMVLPYLVHWVGQEYLQ